MQEEKVYQNRKKIYELIRKENKKEFIGEEVDIKYSETIENKIN